jgi:outer membrane protein OmpA-like peptidoglycan-associated protein/outer membrane protein W
MKRLVGARLLEVVLAAGWGLGAVVSNGQTARPVEKGNEHPWYFAPSLGVVDFEGDQDFKDGIVLGGAIGYDFSERWTAEGVLALAPYLVANNVSGRPSPDWDNTYMMSLALDGLFHFTRWERLDPYLTAGVGFMRYGEEPIEGSQSDWLLRGGVGVLYHFNDEWAVRADWRAMLAGFGSNPNANSILSAGVTWTWGARVAEDFVALASKADSDGDGLADTEEQALGTDPYDPDTDKDRLSDGNEVNVYKTDPLNKDTDWDSLMDGDEVLTYNTNPLKRDTDLGGVADGHEVIEDGTNPLNPKDDLILFELYIQFDLDKAIIRPEFFPAMDVIAKVMHRHPGSTARIEGHADKTRKSGAEYNQQLSKRRAEAVRNYLSTSGKIALDRMVAVGYGFSRPKAPNDPKYGNPLNRRVEVYLKGVNEESPLTGAPITIPAATDQTPSSAAVAEKLPVSEVKAAPAPGVEPAPIAAPVPAPKPVAEPAARDK